MAADLGDDRKNLLAHFLRQGGKLLDRKLAEISGSMNLVEQLGHKLAFSAQLSGRNSLLTADGFLADGFLSSARSTMARAIPLSGSAFLPKTSISFKHSPSSSRTRFFAATTPTTAG